MRQTLLAAGTLVALVTPSFAEMTTTVAPSAMHRRANPRSSVVQTVPANAQVEIRSCGGGWCYGSWRGRYGFLPSFAIAQDSPPRGMFSPPPPPLVVTSPLLVAPPPPPPVHYGWGGPYVGLGWGYGWGRW